FTPSAISKTITSLENELGVQLFIRGPHELLITPAGQMLAQEWRHLIGSINNSIIKVKDYQENSRTKLLFGFVDSSAVMDSLISDAIMKYRKDHPEILIIAEKHDMHRAAELLELGMLDLALTSGIEVDFLKERGLVWEKVSETRVVAYVPRDNPLFEREQICFDDLRGQPLVSLDLLMHPAYNDWLFSLCGSHGFAPDIRFTFRTVRSLQFNLKLNDRIFIGETVTPDLCDENLKSFDLGEKSFTILAWKENTGNEILDFKDYLIRRLR
ncbi:MAG: LysR family transcriptional regulator, partial [Bulleidia sp.]